MKARCDSCGKTKSIAWITYKGSKLCKVCKETMRDFEEPHYER